MSPSDRLRMVVLDLGHGAGTTDVDGAEGRGRREVDVVRLVGRLAAERIAERGIAVQVHDSGPYRSRQQADGVELADLYLCLHADVQPSRTPYALGLSLAPHVTAARQLVSWYAAGVGLRAVDGVAGSESWPRGDVLLRYLPAHVPGVVLELGSLSHAACDPLWLRPETAAAAVAMAVDSYLSRP